MCTPPTAYARGMSGEARIITRTRTATMKIGIHGRILDRSPFSHSRAPGTRRRCAVARCGRRFEGRGTAYSGGKREHVMTMKAKTASIHGAVLLIVVALLVSRATDAN